MAINRADNIIYAISMYHNVTLDEAETIYNIYKDQSMYDSPSMKKKIHVRALMDACAPREAK